MKTLIFLYDYPSLNEAIRLLVDHHNCILIAQKGQVTSTRKELEETFNQIIEMDDLFNPNSVYEVVKELSQTNEISKIITTYEPAVEVAGYVREKFGITGLSLEQSELVRDKYKMKTFLKKFDIRSANICKVNNEKEKIAFLEQNNFPLIMKPFDGAATAKTFTVNNFEDIDSIKMNYPEVSFVLEEFVHGEEYHLDAIVQDGKVILNSVGKYLDNIIDCIEGGATVGSVIYPASHKFSKNLKEMLEMNLRVIDFLGLENCICHTEFFITPYGEVIFSEIAARIGGGKLIGPAIQHIYGINLFEALIAVELGKNIPINKKNDHDFCGFVTFDTTKENVGTVTKIASEKDFHTIDGLIANKILYSIGDEVKKAENSAERTGYIIISGKSEKDVRKKISQSREIYHLEVS